MRNAATRGLALIETVKNPALACLNHKILRNLERTSASVRLLLKPMATRLFLAMTAVLPNALNSLSIWRIEHYTRWETQKEQRLLSTHILLMAVTTMLLTLGMAILLCNRQTMHKMEIDLILPTRTLLKHCSEQPRIISHSLAGIQTMEGPMTMKDMVATPRKIPHMHQILEALKGKGTSATGQRQDV